MLHRFVLAFALVGIVSLALPVATVNAGQFNDNSTDSTGRACSARFLTFPTWYDGLPRKDGTCIVDSPQSGTNGDGVSKFIFTIVLNVIEIVLQLIGYAAVGFIIYGGFKYLVSAGSADRITAGRKIITNALIGLVISFMSVAVVNLVSMNINGTDANVANCDAGTTGGRIDADCVGIDQVGAQQGINGILNSVYYAAGIAAVIVIIISGIFYVISQGEPAKIKRAKDGILYAVVGLVVVLLAFVITNFVIGRF